MAIAQIIGFFPAEEEGNYLSHQSDYSNTSGNLSNPFIPGSEITEIEECAGKVNKGYDA